MSVSAGPAERHRFKPYALPDIIFSTVVLSVCSLILTISSLRSHIKPIKTCQIKKLATFSLKGYAFLI